MIDSALTLQQFCKPVPTCSLAIGLEDLQSLFEASHSEFVVVLGDRQNPLGAIALSALVPYLVGERQLCCHPPPTRRELLDSFEARSLLLPLSSRPGKTRVRDFLASWQGERFEAIGTQLCAIVNDFGQFQGVLDTWRLFSSILPVERAAERLSPVKIQPERGALLQLLERLPIPLVLQSAREDIRYPNRAWREQIGDGDGSENERNSSSDCWEMRYPSSSWCNLTPELDLAPTEAWEEPFAAPESDPRDRAAAPTTWQFIKLPLAVAFGWEEDEAASAFNASILNLQSPMELILATDITEQRQLCKELAAKNADLLQLNRLKDEFLACISHELKTPLTAVLGLSSLLKDSKFGALNPRQERYARLIHQSGRQLMSVVNDLLDLTRIEAGQLNLNFERVQIEAICQRAYEQARSHLARRTVEAETEVQFTFSLEPGLTAIVADELRLRQMLVHLLDNALKFTPAGGEIGLEVSHWRGWIEFTVWDTGIGIPNELQHLIFQKFQQLESPLTRQFEGTGLGLVLTQRLARAHGGDVSFLSKEGEGSQFTLLLPPRLPDEGPAQPQTRAESLPVDVPPSPLEPAQPPVLIVDSTLQTLEQLNDRLQKLGYRVAIARSGTEALEKARGLQPRAIFLAPNLPLLSGWDVLTLLKSDEKTRPIPVAIVALPSEQELARQNRADGFLALPPEKTALQELLYRLERGDCRSLLAGMAKARDVTILRLHPEGLPLDEETIRLTTEFDRAFLLRSSQLNYRILTTDDFEQAEVLARVWHPDLVLLDGLNAAEPVAYLRSLKKYDRLAALPLVTLDAKIAEAANQVEGLLVFPCLVPNNARGVTALLQVIQIAMGLSQKPRISILGNWPCEAASALCFSADESDATPKVARDARFAADECLGQSQELEFLQTLVRYLDRAGFQCFQTCAWPEIYGQIQHQGIDLLLLYLGQPQTARSAVTPPVPAFFLKELQHLAQLPVKPPTLVLDRRSAAQIDTEVELNALLQEVATSVVSGRSYSCNDLLEQIHQLLSS